MKKVDGDQCTCQSVFTEEATKDATNFIYSKLNYSGVAGTAVKELANVSYQAIMSLTRKRF